MSNVADQILALRGWAALAVVFALPALESSAFLGFVFPGEIGVLLGGVLAFQHRVSLGAVLAAAIAGAVIGDTVGYEVGKRWGRHLLEKTVGRFVKRDHLDRAERYLATRGGKAVFLGRFTAALRVLIPGLAGMSGMPYRTFLSYNVAGGALWATGFVLLGYAAGSSWRRVEHVAKRASLVLLLLAVVGAAIVLGARWLAHNPDRVRAFFARQAERPSVAWFRRRYRRQLAFVARRFRPGSAVGLSMTVSLVVVGALGWAFGIVLRDVLSGASMDTLDRPVLRFFVHHREPWLTTAMKAVSTLGSGAVLVPLVMVLGLVWWWRGRTPRPLVVLATAFGGADLLSRVVKELVGRPRPSAFDAVQHFAGKAFPSGHATVAAATWCALACLAAGATSKWGRKVVFWAVAVAVVTLVGVSRLYLGAHWLTDVLGGWALGGVWLAAILMAEAGVRGRRTRPDGSTLADPEMAPSS
jgi:undecaprenyl-diphosphatase